MERKGLVGPLDLKHDGGKQKTARQILHSFLLSDAPKGKTKPTHTKKQSNIMMLLSNRKVKRKREERDRAGHERERERERESEKRERR